MEIVRTSGSPFRRVLVIHSWWGLTQSFRDYAKKLSDEGYLVGLADLFDGRTASTIEEARRLRKMPRKVPMYRSLISNINELREFGGAPSEPVSIIGFSMGGHWAVWLAQQPDLPIRIAVLYYAARGGSFADGEASFLAHFAEKDAWVSKTARRSMANRIAQAGRPLTEFNYPGTTHWFAESARPLEYDVLASELAFERTIAYLGGRT